MTLTILIPAFNEERVVKQVLAGVKKVKISGVKKEIVVIDDGSTDRTYQMAKNSKVIVLRHLLNRGLGGALGTGLEYAKKNKSEIVVTFDADGQHNPEDIKKVIRPIIKNQADFVIGSRLMKNSKMPLDRKIINMGANVFSYLLFGVWVTDTQSGLRALNKLAIAKINIKMNRMEVSSEFLKEAKKSHLRIKEIPIKAIYSKYSRAKGQQNSNALAVIIKLLMYRFAN